MDKTTLYIFALTVGAILGLISLFFKKDNNQKIIEENTFSDETEKKMLKEFAEHHFRELKKISPSITVHDDFPENIFPKALKNILLLEAPEDGDYKEAINAINDNFSPHRLNDEDYIKNRVTVVGNDIFINNDTVKLRNRDIEIQPILKFEKEVPEINIFEDGGIIRTFIIEPRSNNLNLKDQYFHSSIRINSNSSIQIDGYISKNPQNFEKTDEGIRFQPFFLSDKDDMNAKMRGKGMFERGLHYRGIISSGNIRLICICDDCLKSFSIEFYHAGFSEVQYFYSSNSKETLILSYDNNIGKVPIQNQKEIDEVELKELESKLPSTDDGKFEYYNSFNCPYCNYSYINFRDNKDIRPNEIYVNFYINQEPRSI